jgi:hypothetical protein
MAEVELSQEVLELMDRLEAASSDASLNTGDLEAAVELVRSGLANRVVLARFRPWPGLLWHIYQISTETGLLIIPTAAADGLVDITVTREAVDERS